MALAPSNSDEDLFEGIMLLRELIAQIIRPSCASRPGPHSWTRRYENAV
jgi:hypothetical protein